MLFFCPLCPNISKNEFSAKLSFYYKLINILYFALVSKFLTFMKGLEKLFIIGWVVGEEMVREYSDKKQASFVPNPCFTRGKLKWLV